MLLTSIILFTLAALLGLYLISFILQNKNTPKGVTFTHGPLAFFGLLLLIIYACMHKPFPLISIILFALAACGGFFLVYRDITGKSIPKWLAIGHGVTAVIGFVFLIFFYANR